MSAGNEWSRATFRAAENARAVELGASGGVPAEGESAQATAYKVYSCADILALPRPQWRVKGIFPETGIASIFGSSRAGKSFLALDLCFAVTRGAHWFGHKTTSCPALYVNLESNWGLQGRIKAWARDTGQTLPSNLTFIVEAFNLQSQVDISRIIKAAPQHGVVIIDTLNRATPGADENSSKDMGTILKAAGDIQRATSGLVLLVTHSGKDSSKGLRGHSSLFAALDACIEVERLPGSDIRTLKIDKVKEGEDGIRYNFRLKPVFIGTDQDGEDITSCVVEPVEGRQKEEKTLAPALQYALDSFRKSAERAGKDSVFVDDWRPVFYEGHTGDNLKSKAKAFERARKELVNLGKLSVTDSIYRENYQGDKGDIGRHVPLCRAGHQGDTTRHPSLEGVVMSPCRHDGELSL